MEPQPDQSNDKLWGYAAIFSWVLSNLFFLIPLLVPLIVWYHFKTKNKLVSSHGAAVFNFNVLFGLISFVAIGIYAGAILLLTNQLKDFSDARGGYMILGSSVFMYLLVIGIVAVYIWQSIVNLKLLSKNQPPKYIIPYKIIKYDSKPESVVT